MLQRFMPLGKVAIVLGLPQSYLHELAADHAIPHLEVRRQVFADARAVKAKLDQIADSAGANHKENHVNRPE